MSVRNIDKYVVSGETMLDVVSFGGMNKEDLIMAIAPVMKVYSEKKEDFNLILTEEAEGKDVIFQYLVLYGSDSTAIPQVLGGRFATEKAERLSGENVEIVAKMIADQAFSLSFADKMKEKYPDLSSYARDAMEFSKVFSRKGIAGIINAFNHYKKTGRSLDVSKVVVGTFLSEYETAQKAFSMMESCREEFKKLDKKYKGAWAGFLEARNVLSAMKEEDLSKESVLGEPFAERE